jgi:K+-transporting ATPase ATPase C chain
MYMSILRSAPVRQYAAAARTLLVLTVVVGLAYPLAMTGLAQVAFHSNANGSLLHRDGEVVGSTLIGQGFGADPRYFQSRPSAAGKGYDPTASGASNLGPRSPDLVDQIRQRRAAAAALDGVAPGRVPPDALTASGSGLDPGISPAYANEQVARVARVRGLATTTVQGLVARYTQGRDLGFLGEPVVNVLELNLALDRASAAKSQ